MISHPKSSHKHSLLDNFTAGLSYRLANNLISRAEEGIPVPSNVVKPSQSLPSLVSPSDSDSVPKRPTQPSNRPIDSLPHPAPSPDHITIRVIDDAHALTKSFICPAPLLLSSMAYFRDNLSSYQDNWQEIDISVHCDLQVFSWLMEYILSSASRPAPRLDVKRVFSVLVSSEYLGMPGLVEACIQFISENASAVLAVHSSAECLNQEAVDRLASLLSSGEIEAIQDPKDLLQDRLFASKLRILMDPQSSDSSRPFPLTSVYRCSDCQLCVVSGLEPLFLCGGGSSKVRISPQGNLFYMHRRDPVWCVRQQLEEQRRQGTPSRDRFWRAWSYSHLFFCSACKYLFIACDASVCSHQKVGPGSGLRTSRSSFILIPSLLPSDPQPHSPAEEDSLPAFEQKMGPRISELLARGCNSPNLSVWTRHVFDRSVRELLSLSAQFASKSHPTRVPNSPSSASLSDIMLFSQDAMSCSLTRSQFYCLGEETAALPAPTSSKQRLNTRTGSRDPGAHRNLRLKPFTGSVNGEVELGTEGDDDEMSEGNSRTVSSLAKSRSISSQHNFSPEDSKHSASTWSLMRSRKNNIDLQRESEYVRSLNIARCVQNLVMTKFHKNAQTTQQQQPQTNNSISERIERNFKANLTSSKLQKYQQTTNPKLKKAYPPKQ